MPTVHDLIATAKPSCMHIPLARKARQLCVLWWRLWTLSDCHHSRTQLLILTINKFGLFDRAGAGLSIIRERSSPRGNAVPPPGEPGGNQVGNQGEPGVGELARQ